MFTGIVESMGKIIALRKEKSNLSLTVQTSFANDLIMGQSIAHNGVCLTVETMDVKKLQYTVTAVKETLIKSNLSEIKKNRLVNLERSLKVGDRIDGHFVQGHVDTTARVQSILKEKGSWVFTFFVPIGTNNHYKNLIVDKGSICINGVSLTVVASTLQKNRLFFSVAVIPHTFKHTNFCFLKKGNKVNIEWDVLGKYIHAIASKQLSN
jgi:riboflavin synthase